MDTSIVRGAVDDTELPEYTYAIIQKKKKVLLHFSSSVTRIKKENKLSLSRLVAREWSILKGIIILVITLPATTVISIVVVVVVLALTLQIPRPHWVREGPTLLLSEVKVVKRWRLPRSPTKTRSGSNQRIVLCFNIALCCI
ncbi:hypothetical protein E2542_SST02278 [Spatholobus suberectus]|nr:hypothetical protein E2542_SST02278 [Spatholobus suberectus]